MPACGYEFYLLVFNSLRSLMRYRVEKLLGPKRSIQITDHFTYISANVIYCITCTLCRKLCISVTGRPLGDRFREHLRDVEKDDKTHDEQSFKKQHMADLRPFLASRKH